MKNLGTLESLNDVFLSKFQKDLVEYRHAPKVALSGLFDDGTICVETDGGLSIVRGRIDFYDKNKLCPLFQWMGQPIIGNISKFISSLSTFDDPYNMPIYDTDTYTKLAGTASFAMGGGGGPLFAVEWQLSNADWVSIYAACHGLISIMSLRPTYRDFVVVGGPRCDIRPEFCSRFPLVTLTQSQLVMRQMETMVVSKVGKYAVELSEYVLPAGSYSDERREAQAVISGAKAYVFDILAILLSVPNQIIIVPNDTMGVVGQVGKLIGRKVQSMHYSSTAASFIRGYGLQVFVTPMINLTHKQDCIMFIPEVSSDLELKTFIAAAPQFPIIVLDKTGYFPCSSTFFQHQGATDPIYLRNCCLKPLTITLSFSLKTNTPVMTDYLREAGIDSLFAVSDVEGASHVKLRQSVGDLPCVCSQNPDLVEGIVKIQKFTYDSIQLFFTNIDQGHDKYVDLQTGKCLFLQFVRTDKLKVLASDLANIDADAAVVITQCMFRHSRSVNVKLKGDDDYVKAYFIPAGSRVTVGSASCLGKIIVGSSPSHPVEGGDEEESFLEERVRIFDSFNSIHYFRADSRVCTLQSQYLHIPKTSTVQAYVDMDDRDQRNMYAIMRTLLIDRWKSSLPRAVELYAALGWKIIEKAFPYSVFKDEFKRHISDDPGTHFLFLTPGGPPLSNGDAGHTDAELNFYQQYLRRYSTVPPGSFVESSTFLCIQ
jgi:hypothetical protein